MQPGGFEVGPFVIMLVGFGVAGALGIYYVFKPQDRDDRLGRLGPYIVYLVLTAVHAGFFAYQPWRVALAKNYVVIFEPLGVLLVIGVVGLCFAFLVAIVAFLIRSLVGRGQ